MGTPSNLSFPCAFIRCPATRPGTLYSIMSMWNDGMLLVSCLELQMCWLLFAVSGSNPKMSLLVLLRLMAMLTLQVLFATKVNRPN